MQHCNEAITANRSVHNSTRQPRCWQSDAATEPLPCQSRRHSNDASSRTGPAGVGSELGYELCARHEATARRAHRRASGSLIVSLACRSVGVAGCSYDFETRAVARLLKGHTKPVVALRYEHATSRWAAYACTHRCAATNCKFKFAPLRASPVPVCVGVCTSLCSWSATSHHLLSASLDGHVIRWNVLAGTAGSYATFAANSCKVKSVQLHPTIASVAQPDTQTSHCRSMPPAIISPG